ncbi:MAG: glycosyltransferase [Bacteroidales bacterium]
MRVWLIKREERVPLNEHGNDRLLRMGSLAFALAARGHEVVWWASSFDHWRKRQVVTADAAVQLTENLEARLLKGCGYRRNVSPSRFVDEAIVSRKLSSWARRDPKQPDLIVSALPSVELCRAAVQFGRAARVPVVLDMRDMWPDIFVEMSPKMLRPVARLLFQPLFRRAHQACAGAVAITGITEAFVDWGVSRANRPRTPWDRCFPFGYASRPPSAERVAEAERFWDGLGVRADGHFTVSFVGSLDNQRDIATVIEAARWLAADRVDVRFVICGEGERLAHFRGASADLPNVLWPGWIDAAAIYVLLRRSAAGLNPMPERFDYLASINNKAIEYLSAGVPVISSPARGVLAALVREQQCGLCYARGDVDGLVRLLGQLHRDAPLRRSLSANASRLFRDRFTAEKVYADMCDHLEHIACSFRSGRAEAVTA